MNLTIEFRSKKLIIAVITVILISTWLHSQNNWIQVESFNFEITNIPKELDGFRIAHLSDLHLPKNAYSINGIISLIKNQNPDIIVLTGDIIDASADIINCGLDQLAHGLAEISPTYAVTGNHEYWNGNIALWRKTLEENNVVVLENKSVEKKFKGQSFLLVGVEDEQPLSTISTNTYKVSFKPIILLAHRPELWQSYIADKNLKPDLIFSGHAHGGQFRIPFWRGLISPNQGILPKTTSGLYNLDNSTKMIVSRGLGNSIIPIRINNRPHIPIVTLKVKKE